MAVWDTRFTDGEKIKCTHCKKELDKWIDIVPFGELCPNCAQYYHRILLQDIIEYHNDKSVSLLNIMFHGTKDENRRPLKNKDCWDTKY